jgi:hypothetical protein
MVSQLVAGQWVEVSMQDLRTPVLLSGFVLGLQPRGVLLTFPELLAPPEGLDIEAHATLCYRNHSGRHTAVGHILRVVAGPPVTVTFKHPVPMTTDPRRLPVRTAARLPVSLHLVFPSASPPPGQEDLHGSTENLGASGAFVWTSRLLAVGDVLRLAVSLGAESAVVRGRVVRIVESEDGEDHRFGVGVEFVHATETERECWLAFLARLQSRDRR